MYRMEPMLGPLSQERARRAMSSHTGALACGRASPFGVMRKRKPFPRAGRSRESRRSVDRVVAGPGGTR